MPIFEYQCNSCNKIFEVLQLPGYHGNELKCPDCNGVNLKKLISLPFLPSSVGKPANDDFKFDEDSIGEEAESDSFSEDDLD